MIEFIALAQQCAPTVHPQTMAAVAQVESTFNPYAIGVVGGRLQRQPRSFDEAVATAYALEAEGWNFSIGLAQVNRYNLPKYELTYEQGFDPCANLRAGSMILEDCYVRAQQRMPDSDPQETLQAAFSCYYSGNFTRGFKPDRHGDPSYVQKVVAAAEVQAQAIPVVPRVVGAPPPQRDRAAGAAPSPAVPATAPVAPAAATPPRPPADHSSVLVDLDARRQASTPPMQADEASASTTQADTGAAEPVLLQRATPQQAQPVPPARNADIVIF